MISSREGRGWEPGESLYLFLGKRGVRRGEGKDAIPERETVNTTSLGDTGVGGRVGLGGHDFTSSY